MKVDNREMGTQQLLDALTDHLALYHRKASRIPVNDKQSKGSLKEKALLWFRSLSLEQRRSALTIFDRSWVTLVLQMHRRLAKEGRGYFLVLPDVPQKEPLPASGIKAANPGSHVSPSSKPDQMSAFVEPKKARKSFKIRKKPSTAVTPVRECAPAMALPSLCFRKARGLLARLDEEHAAGELLCSNLEVSSSVAATAINPNGLDVACISEELLRDPDQFFATMDTITYGGFLSSVGASQQDSLWEELPWLESMGYYTMPAFVANKLELAMWLAWLNDEGIHRPPKNWSKELRKTGWNVKAHSINTSAMTVCKRYKAFKDWWIMLEEDARFNMLRFAVAKAVKMEVIQAKNCASKSGLKLELREVFRTAQSVDSDFYRGITQVSGVKSVFGSYIVGLDVLQELVSSPWGITLTRCSEASRATDYVPSVWSCLNSADTLPGNIMRRACHVLHDVMVKFTELELLKTESCTSQAAQPKAKKEGRRKKSRNSELNSRKMNSGDEVGGGLLRPEETPNIATFDSNKLEEEHEEVENLKVEKCKPSKKKRHARERRSECNGTRTSDEARVSPGSTCKGEVESSYRQSISVQTLEVPLADNNSKELPAFQSFKADDHHSSRVDLLSQHIDSSERDLSNFSNLEPGKAQDNLDNAGDVDEGLDGQERGSPNEGIETLSLEENSVKQATTVCCPSGDFCSIKNEVNVKSTADTMLLTDVASTNLGKRCPNIEVSDTQSLSPSQNNLYHTSGLSKSFFSSHTARERYWESLRSHTMNSKNSTLGLSTAHEWPGTFQVHFSRGRSHVISPATERLNLDVGRNWQQRLQASFIALRNPIVKVQSGPLSNQKWSSNMQTNVKSSDCAPMFSPGYAPNRSYSYGFREETAVLQAAFPLPFVSPDLSMLARSQDDARHDDRTPDDTDYDESNYFSGDFDDHEGYIISEEETERQLLDMETHGEGDYNQYFGGGVMFWNTADYAGTGYSRPPSLSSEDSSWARHEADLSVVLDDIMGFPPIPSSYTSVANPGMASTSPPPTYHSGFEHGVPIPGNEFGKFSPLSPAPSKKPEDEKSPSDLSKGGSIDGTGPDLVSIPLLRPIIVVRDSSLESIRHHEARSPHVPQRRRELPRQRRPPSPVLRCVLPSPPPPPPSPVSEFGKRKGLTTARSGSSSPRRWGLVNSHHKEEQDVPFVLSEVLESAWGKRNLREKASIHPISGSVLRERLFTIPPLTVEKDHPDIALPMQTTLLFNSDPSLQLAITRLHNILHKEIEGFCKQVAAENLLRKPSISTAIDKVTHAMQVLWPRSRLKVFGSTATGLALPCSDVDLVVCLPPVRNLEPIKEAGILEGRNGIKETCLQHAARYLADQDWVKSDTLKTIENTTIPIIMLVAHVTPHSYNVPDCEDSLDEVHANSKKAASGEGNGPWGGSVDREFVRLDISFEAPSHTGLRTAELVRELRAQFPAITPLALVLKQFLTDRSLDHPYTGGLSSYCLVILITRFLQHQHHLGCPFQQNLGSLLMDFLHFFGCVFDPRRMGICIRGGGTYVSRDRGHSIDPLHIEDPLYPTNNVGRNCFRILQCVKAFADAYSYIEKSLVDFKDNNIKVESFNLLSNILPSVQSLKLLPDLI